MKRDTSAIHRALCDFIGFVYISFRFRWYHLRRNKLFLRIFASLRGIIFVLVFLFSVVVIVICGALISLSLFFLLLFSPLNRRVELFAFRHLFQPLWLYVFTSTTIRRRHLRSLLRALHTRRFRFEQLFSGELLRDERLLAYSARHLRAKYVKLFNFCTRRLRSGLSYFSLLLFSFFSLLLLLFFLILLSFLLLGVIDRSFLDNLFFPLFLALLLHLLVLVVVGVCLLVEDHHWETKFIVEIGNSCVSHL